MATRTSRVTGLSDVRNLLKQLPANVEKKVMGASVRAGATVMRAAVRSAAPVGDEPSAASEKYGSLKSNIRVIRLRYDVPKGGAMFRVDTGKAFWGSFYEFGTSRQPARPWFRPAADTTFEKAVNRIKERLAAGVEREAKKLGGSRR